jgi:hypothetical protein
VIFNRWLILFILGVIVTLLSDLLAGLLSIVFISAAAIELDIAIRKITHQKEVHNIVLFWAITTFFCGCAMAWFLQYGYQLWHMILIILCGWFSIGFTIGISNHFPNNKKSL